MMPEIYFYGRSSVGGSLRKVYLKKVEIDYCEKIRQWFLTLIGIGLPQLLLWMHLLLLLRIASNDNCIAN